jgi:hypothetical protein
MILRLLGFVLVLTTAAALAIFAPSVEGRLEYPQALGSYSVKALDQSVVCPGPLVRSGGESGTKLGVFDRIGKAELYSSIAKAPAGELELNELEAGSTQRIEFGDSRIVTKKALQDATGLRVVNRKDEANQGSLLMTASQLQLAASAGIRGAAAASRQQPSNDFWLVGGSTATSREALLILSNPSRLDATADLRIFTDLGELQVAGLSGISVLSQSTLVISLASFAPSVSELVIQVQSQGAKLAGWIQQKTIRGTQAMGVDLITPSTPFSTEQVIPGFVIRGSKEIEKLKRSSEDFADVGHALRVFAPEGATITVQVVSADPENFGAVFIGTLEPQLVTDFPIDELLDGDYSVFISSDAPIIAGLRVGRATEDGNPRSDFSWLSPSELITSERAVAVGDSGVSYLMLANSENDAASVVVTDLITGTKKTVMVPATGTLSLQVTGIISIAPAQKIFGAVAILSEGQISNFEILDPVNLGAEVAVRFR